MVLRFQQSVQNYKRENKQTESRINSEQINIIFYYQNNVSFLKYIQSMESYVSFKSFQ